MNEQTIESNSNIQDPEIQDQLISLFNQGWGCLINRQWQLAEETFAAIESYNSHFEQDGLRASYLRKKAQYEREAEVAEQSGDLESALEAYKKADDFEHARDIYQKLTIQELETKATALAATADYQAAAWIYDHLLNEFPTHEKELNWQIKKESCWEAELLPYFHLGEQALEQGQWRTAYNAFAQVLAIDPYFRMNGHAAAALSEKARKEVVLWADQQLRQGQTKEALAAYREVSHLARIENVDEFLRLRGREEAKAMELEAEGQWQDAATKYSYLSTLYYDENGRNQWQAAANRCQEEAKVSALYKQAMTAVTNKAWHTAEKLLRQLITIRPHYQPDETAEPAKKLYRTVRWRVALSWLIPQGNNTVPPRIQTGKLS